MRKRAESELSEDGVIRYTRVRLLGRGAFGTAVLYSREVIF